MAKPSTTMPPGLDRFVIINGHPDHAEEITGGSINVTGEDPGGAPVAYPPMAVPVVTEEKAVLLKPPAGQPVMRAHVITILIHSNGCDFHWNLDFTGKPWWPVYVAVGYHQSWEDDREVRPICHVLLNTGLTRCYPGVMTPT
jgi:hypothetical protein